MKEYLKETSYDQILALNSGNRFKADRVVDYYLLRDNLLKVNSMSPSNQKFVVNFLYLDDLKYRAVDFEPPIGKREWVAWGLLALSIISSLIVACI